ncbi:MAG: bifunctional nuclease family protein, partial [Armatimonadetes bacterium]|nr:bifunctional nuclease family protein [Armatimonadota bacterium]
YAEIHVARDGQNLVVDSRPSDAIALALRVEAPIYIDEKVAAQAITLKKPFAENEVEEFRKFLEQVKPEDFKRTIH